MNIFQSVFAAIIAYILIETLLGFEPNYHIFIMAYARWIVANATRCGLTVRSDEVIPMDGNSWYQSVVQQLKRPEIARYIGAHGRTR